MFSPFNLPPGILLLVTDTLASPADWVLHRALIEQLKPASKSKSDSLATPQKAIVLAVSEDLARWKAIAAKSNLHLDQKAAAGSFVFIDVLQRVPPPDTDTDNDASAPALRPIFNAVVTALGSGNADGDALVILDDLATLAWLGFPVLALTRFSRALGAACRTANATLLIRQHVLTPPPGAAESEGLDELSRALRQLCAYHMEVLPLASGRSGAVSGQVALHVGPATPTRKSGVRLLSRGAALQYKLTDGGAVFFERGTGAGVL
ncbi:hypothetical protein C8R46DRAFT_877593 [Mycena filopes]|nr:hypothetical protein C8R46DRAFT_877593 [Mycena filopes]